MELTADNPFLTKSYQIIRCWIPKYNVFFTLYPNWDADGTTGELCHC